MSQSGQVNLVSSLADPEGISKLHEETALTPITFFSTQFCVPIGDFLWQHGGGKKLSMAYRQLL